MLRFTVHTKAFLSIAVFLLISAISVPSFGAKSPALQKIDKNGIVIEHLPAMKSLAQKVHTWLSEDLIQNPFDLNQDLKKLKDHQSKIIEFFSHELALDHPSETLERILPEIFIKFQNIGNVIPNIRHLQLWTKKDLKVYLDGGGSIPGYSYKPGSDGENELKMEQGIQTTKDDPLQAMTIQSPLFPLILKSEDPKQYFDEATQSLTEMRQQFQRMASGMSGLLLMMSIQPAIHAEIAPPMNQFNWFTGGLAGYLTGQILNDSISVDAAKYFIESQSVKPYVKLMPQIHLVKWIGEESNEMGKNPQAEVIKRARYAFSIYEMMGLVRRNGPEALPKIFTELRKKSPTDQSKASAQEKKKDYSGEELVQGLEKILDAIEKATGENFRSRLIQYSQTSSQSAPQTHPQTEKKDS